MINIISSLLKFGAVACCLSLIVSACQDKKPKVYSGTERAAETKQLNNFFEINFQKMLARNPEYESYVGGKKYYDQWTDRSDEHARREMEITKANLAEMRKTYDYNALNAQGQLSYKMYEYIAEEEINNFK